MWTAKTEKYQCYLNWNSKNVAAAVVLVSRCRQNGRLPNDYVKEVPCLCDAERIGVFLSKGMVIFLSITGEPQVESLSMFQSFILPQLIAKTGAICKNLCLDFKHPQSSGEF